jgi:hypothetical protein
MKSMYELSGRGNQINAFKNGSSECLLLALSGHPYLSCAKIVAQLSGI